MAQTPHPTSQLLILGVAQAVLFVVGGLLGRWIGMAFGIDAFASAGYSAREMIGILLVGLGAGGLFGHGEGESIAGLVHLQCGLDVAARILRLGHRGNTQFP